MADVKSEVERPNNKQKPADKQAKKHGILRKNDDEVSEILPAILSAYLEVESSKKPYLIKDGIKIIL